MLGKCFDHKGFRSEVDNLENGPKMMRPGDEVCVLFGGTPLYILSPMGDYDVFVGDTYLNS